MAPNRIKKVIFLIGFILCCFQIRAQPNDSLYQANILLATTGAPEQKAEALLNIADSWRRFNLDSSLKYGYQSMEYSKSLELKQNLGRTYKSLCIYYRSTGNKDSTIKYGNLAIEDRFVTNLSPEEFGAVYRALCISYLEKSNWNKADAYAHKMLSNQDLSPAYKFQAYSTLAAVMRSLEDHEKSREYLRSAQKIAIEEDNQRMNTSLNYSILKYYVVTDKIDSALIYSDRILANAKESGNQEAIQVAKTARANTLLEAEDYKGALNLAQSIDQKYVKRTLIIGSIDIIKGTCYVQLNQPKKAISHLLKVINLSTKLGEKFMLTAAYESIAEAYLMTGDLEKHISFNEKFSQLRVEEDQIATNKLIDRLEIEKLKQEKDNTIQELKYNQLLQENKLAQLKWLGLLLVVLAAGGIGVYYWYNQSKSSKLEEEISKNKLHALRATMNPHFLFNSINSLQYFILNSERYQAYNFITNFSKLLRSTLESSNTLEASLEKEIGLIKSYIELEQIRLNSNFDYKIPVDKSLENAKLKIPSMIIQPYIENAIIHGLSNKTEDKQLEVSIDQLDVQYLQFTIHDNGIGRAAASKIKAKNSRNHLSIAISNSMERIELLKKLGYKKSSMSIEDLVASDGSALGTKVLIQLPLLA